MAYERLNWVDHVVERPNTYREQVNDDGTKTCIDATGEVIQQGTPMSARNFNNLEEGLQHYAVAFDMLMTINQPTVRDLSARIELLKNLEQNALPSAEEVSF